MALASRGPGRGRGEGLPSPRLKDLARCCPSALACDTRQAGEACVEARQRLGMDTFLYGALGALLPELHRWLSLRPDLKDADLSVTRAAVCSATITLAWLLAAGLFAQALPGDVSSLTAIYAGLSLPAAIGLATKKPLTLNIDTIELDSTTRLRDLFRYVFTASWR